jgi:hypothetical protein
VLAGQAALDTTQAKVRATLEEIRWGPSTLRMVLEPFTPAQTRVFLSQALHGIPISEAEAWNWWEKTGGLAMYIEQV